MTDAPAPAPPWRMIVAGGLVLIAVAVLIWAVKSRSSGPLSHRAAYNNAQAGYWMVQDENAQQAFATPAQLTALLHSFIADQAHVHVQPDEQAGWSGMLAAARAEMTALCELPASRADELSSIDNLDQYCPLSRPLLLSQVGLSDVSRAEEHLAQAVDALPVR